MLRLPSHLPVLLSCAALLFGLAACDSAGGDSGGETPPPENSTSAPAAPSSLEGTSSMDASDEARVLLEWEAPEDDDLVGYHVYRSTSSFSTRENATRISGDALVEGVTYHDTEIQNGTTYYYRVTAVDEAGHESALSSEIQVATEETQDSGEMAATIKEIDARMNAAMPEADTPSSERDFLSELQNAAQEIERLSGVDTVAVHRNFLSATVKLESGVPVIISNNRPTDETGTSNAGGAAAGVRIDTNRLARARARHAKQSAPPSEGSSRQVRDYRQARSRAVAPTAKLPGSKRAVVVSIGGGQPQANRVENLLSSAGYQISNLGGSLADMRNYQNIGVLYLDTHGAAFAPITEIEDDGLSWGSSRYALQTSTRAEASREWIDAHREELLAGDIVLAKFNDDAFKVAITESFIAEHWDLAEGFALIHACYFGAGSFTIDGATFDSTPMQEAILESARALVSFDNYTNASYAQGSIHYTFGMLLGQGFYAERAWDLGTVRAALQEMDLTQFDKPDFTIGPFGFGGNTVNMTFHGNANTTLNPSLRGIDVIDDAAQKKGRLVLHGRFGSEQGKVYVGTTELPVTKWESGKVVARSPHDGDGSTGWVRVETPNGLQSNGVNLTEWQGQLYGYAINDEGSLKGQTSLLVEFRADVHRRRDAPTEYRSFPKRVETYIADAHGYIKGTGRHVAEGDPDITTYWKGKNNYRILNKAEVTEGGPPAKTEVVEQDGHQLEHDSFFGGKVILQPGTNEAALCLRMFGKFTERRVWDHPDIPTESWEIGFAFMRDLQAHADTYTDTFGLICMPLQMTDLPDLNLPYSSLSVDQGGGRIRVGWGTIEATNPPAPAP